MRIVLRWFTTSELAATSCITYYKYGLDMVDVFDTMAGHIVVTNWMVERKETRAK